MAAPTLLQALQRGPRGQCFYVLVIAPPLGPPYGSEPRTKNPEPTKTMSRTTSKPSRQYADNYDAIFGAGSKRAGSKRAESRRTGPKHPPGRSRSYSVYDPQQKRWVALDERPAAERRVSLWPMHSDAFGVHPSQAAEAYRESVAAGVPTEFDPRTGQAVFRDRYHRKRAVEALSPMYDLDGGYSDPQPRGEFLNDR
jgi:hypothetical protein